MPSTGRVVIVAEHDDLLRDVLVDAVGRVLDLSVIECRDGAQLARTLRMMRPELVVVDPRMLAGTARAAGGSPVLFTDRLPGGNPALSAVHAELTRPFDLDDFVKALSALLEPCSV